MGVKVNEDLLVDEAQQDGEVLPAGVYLEGEPVPSDRTKLFEVNGRQYTVPKVVNPQVMFRYLRSVRRDESDRATADMLYDVLGEAVMDALADEKLSPDEFSQVMRAIRKHVMGSTELTLGNSSNGRPR